MQTLKYSFATLCLAISGATFAQTTYGTISGSITDASSAVIRGAKVEATNQQTQVAHTLETDNDGRYRFVNLDRGVYTIAVTAPGFSRTEQKDIILEARAEIPI